MIPIVALCGDAFGDLGYKLNDKTVQNPYFVSLSVVETV
jgi:hypothetical protein